MSDSTVQDVSIAKETDVGGFKVVISKPRDDQRPRTTESIKRDEAPILQISIPSWKLGTPRFTLQGTPLIRGSSYAPTEDFRSNRISFVNGSQRGDLNSLHLESLKPSPAMFPHSNLPSPIKVSPSSARFPQPPPRATYLSSHFVIEPAMYDALTFRPGRDDRSIVRYSPTGAVTAATPPRLVSEITSPCFLDYDLLSDFFLTFRTFLDPADLLRMLVARLKWAISRTDETGMIVRVRAFVAMRHWILNYFVDDFMVDYQMRITFCDLINEYVEELAEDKRRSTTRLQILAELKKCWRRVCAQYWDGPAFDGNVGPEVPITPGGIAGHRDPGLDPSFWATDGEELERHSGIDLPASNPRNGTSFDGNNDNAGNIDALLAGGSYPSERAATPEQPSAPRNLERQIRSPMSVASLDVVSCSFPTKGFRMGEPTASYALAAHPVDPSSIHVNTDPIAATPRALTGKRVRTQASHKRNVSLSGSLREHGDGGMVPAAPAADEKGLYKSSDALLTLPYGGSLVRGNLMPPGQALVEIASPKRLGRETTLFQPQSPETSAGKGTASAMSGAGMKKLLGSVRRALSTKGQYAPPSQGNNYLSISPIGPRGVTENRIPGTAVVPQARPPRSAGRRAPVRIDVLAAGIAEDFRKAVREDSAAGTPSPDVPTKLTTDNIEYSAAHLDSSFDLEPRSEKRPSSDADITAGSKSIVIVDGTLPHDYPSMSGALGPVTASVEAFADSLVPTGANLTPPTTPPDKTIEGNPRISSVVLGTQSPEPISVSEEPLPPFVPDLATLGGRHSEEITRHSLASFERPSPDYMMRSSHAPPRASFYTHRRQQSSRSFRTSHSVAHRRWASIHSTFPRSTVKSFDATTYTEGSVTSEVMPPPLRVLRRRPGGDLRGAHNVADLDHQPLRRSRSVGSLTTFSESLRSSYLHSPLRDSSARVDVVSSNFSQHRVDHFSLGRMAEKAPQRRMSVFSTRSSKPAMRPSFEAEAIKLAQIPDDEDDGGVESALAKLEGKFERRLARRSIRPLSIAVSDIAEGDDESPVEPKEHFTPEKRRHRQQHVVDDGVSMVAPSEYAEARAAPDVAPSDTSFLSDGSADSYNSTPLLHRGLTDDGKSRNSPEWANHSILQVSDGDLTPRDERPSLAAPLSPSYEVVKKTESMDRIAPEETQPPPSVAGSFFNDGSDEDSELSSELSIEMVEADEFGLNPAYRGPRPAVAGPKPDVDPSKINTPPKNSVSSAVKIGAPMSPRSLETAFTPQLHEHQLWPLNPVKRMPPTPDMTPHTSNRRQLDSLDYSMAAKEPPANAAGPDEVSAAQPPAHLPFILAFDSEVLAQQFTLIEKDALNEVDWKELIEMRWRNSHTNSRSWVDFLRNSDARGVEVVVARFNIMVKWVVSEVVLTQNVEERARCIIKLLHIAAHCRRYRNFATLSQIAIALTSTEVARLSKTWALLPPSDMQTMREVESLVSPTKNFYNLRAEMEGSATAAEMGCIPFLGIYTHDILFNAQRPSEIASSPTTAPLVNFERCRIAAAVVKTLLRLLEASTLYQFQPIEGITERCLWMSALSDDDIRRYSETIEPSFA